METIQSSLGSYVSIQISAKYGEFNNASVSFHVSSSSSSTYSAASGNVDATIENGQLKNYRLFTNGLNLDSTTVREELEANLPTIVTNFQAYMCNTLYLEVK